MNETPSQPSPGNGSRHRPPQFPFWFPPWLDANAACGAETDASSKAAIKAFFIVITFLAGIGLLKVRIDHYRPVKFSFNSD